MIYDSLSEQPIYCYTRKQAITDGVLVDLTGYEVIKRHWRYPLAATSAVWNTISSAICDDDNDLDGILHDLSMLAKTQMLANNKKDLVRFPAKIGKKNMRIETSHRPRRRARAGLDAHVCRRGLNWRKHAKRRLHKTP